MFKFWKTKEEDKKDSKYIFSPYSRTTIKDIEEKTKPVLTIVHKYEFLIETLWEHYNVKLPEFTAIPRNYFDPDIIREIPFLTQEDKQKLSQWGEYYTKAWEQYVKIFNGEE